MTHDRVPQVFRTDRSPQSRNAERRREAISRKIPVARNMGDFWTNLAAKVDCEECGAKANESCISKAKTTYGKPAEGFHQKRFHKAREVFGKKK